MRLAILRVVVAVAFACWGCGRADPAASTGRPNLLLITVDTLRADRLECYGGEPGVGRAICGIADGGVRYLWALSPAPSTAPAIASILTSRYPSYHEVTQFAVTTLETSARTLAEELAGAGYATAAIVSNPVLDARRGLGQGFDVYDTEMTRVERNRKGFIEREAESATDAAMEWLEGAAAPWFLWVHYQDPHGPYEPPGAGRARDAAEAEALPVLADHSGFRGIPRYQALPGVFAAATYERRYLDEIIYLDREVARLLEYVDVARPAILLTADHGEAFGEDEHWFAHGHSVGLEQARVPLLWHPVHGPAAEPVVRETVSTVDVAPTLLSAAGIRLPKTFQGIPLPATSNAADGTRSIFVEHRLRVGVAAGRLYYARDRLALGAPLADAITGGLLRPMAPRSVHLGDDGRLPTGRGATRDAPPGGAGGALEPLLERYLVDAGARTEPNREGLTEETRRQLEALGYLN